MGRRVVGGAAVAVVGVGLLLLFWPRGQDAARTGERRGAPAVRASAEGERAAVYWGGQRGLAGRRVAGRVTVADGVGVKDAVVRIYLDDGFDAVLREVVTDQGGRFDFGAVPAARYQVSAQ